MKKSKTRMVILFAILVSIAIALYGNEGKGMNKVECETHINNPYLLDSRIDSVNCFDSGDTCIIGSAFVLPQLSFGLTDDVSVQWSASNTKLTRSYTIAEGKTRVIAQSVCTDDLKIKLTLFDEDNQIVDERSVVIQ